MWPGQVVLAISQIFWTTEVEEAIGDYEQNGLEEYVKKLQLQIDSVARRFERFLRACFVHIWSLWTLFQY
jgi:hypothetical protein